MSARRPGGEERRRALVQAAITVVAREGYARASLAEVARTAGMSKGLLWHYYADGEELMAAAARAALVRVREAVAADVDLTAPVPAVVRAAIARAARLPSTHPEEMAAITSIATHLRAGDGSLALTAQEYAETYALQERLFVRGVREGSLRPLDPHLTAVLYQGAIDAMIGHLRASPAADPDEVATAVADLVLAGIGATG